MKYRMQVLLGMVCVSLLLYAWSMQAGPLSQQGSNARSGIHVRTVAPLEIVGNAQLAAAASGGNGSCTSPYLLSHKGINVSEAGQNGITIRNTNAYFILKDCWVIGSHISSYAGVRLSNVTHARLENVTATHNYYGIILQAGSNNTLVGNDVSFSVSIGIYLSESNNNTITGNIANYNSAGFEFHFSDFNIVTGNIASGGQYGVWLITSDYNQVVGNTLRGNDHCVSEGACFGNTIASNDCGTEIPGFPWVLVCLGLLSALGLGLLLRRTYIDLI